MKRKILGLLMVGALTLGLTGCGDNIISKTSTKESNKELNNNDNNLTCSGKTSLMIDIVYSNSDEGIRIAAIERSNEYIENGKYTFVYNNDGLTNITGKEIFKKSFSTEITDEQMKEANEEEAFKAYKDSNNKVVIEYTLDKNDDLVKALKNKNNLKEWLEENTNLTCNGE